MGLQHNGRLVFLTVDLRDEAEFPRRIVTMPAHNVKSFGRDDPLVIAGYGLIWRVLYPQGAVAIGVRLRRNFPVLRWWRRNPIQKLVYSLLNVVPSEA